MPREGQYGAHSGTHCGGSPLWQVDRDAVRAINARTQHQKRGRPPIGGRWKLYGCLVTVVAAKQPYGVAERTRVNTVWHLTDRVCLVWRGGMLLGAQAMWLCGSTTEWFRMLLEPPQQYPICRVCGYTAWPGVSVNVNIGQVVIGCGQD